jgi:hypothetical protein
MSLAELRISVASAGDGEIERILRTGVIDWITPAATINFTTFAAFAEPNLGLPVSIVPVLFFASDTMPLANPV